MKCVIGSNKLDAISFENKESYDSICFTRADSALHIGYDYQHIEESEMKAVIDAFSNREYSMDTVEVIPNELRVTRVCGETYYERADADCGWYAVSVSDDELDVAVTVLSEMFEELIESRN